MSKSSLHKPGKTNKSVQIHNHAVLVNNIKSEIDIFAGNRTNARYKDLQKILVTTSIKVQDLKHKTGKQHNRDYCEEIQGQIQHCIQRLESRASFNAKKDFTPFVLHKLTLPEVTLADITEEENSASAWRLAEIEEESDRLERDLKSFIDLGDVKQLSYLEKQIRLLYKQLELVSAKNYTPIGDKKLEIGKKLIKCNNQIRKVKRNIKRKSKISSFRERSDDLVETVEGQLDELEAAVVSFDGLERRRYSELQQSLEWQKINLGKISNNYSDSKRRSSLLIGRVNSLLLDLEQRASQTEDQQIVKEQGLPLSSFDLLEHAREFENKWNHIDKDQRISNNSETCRIIINILENITDELYDRISSLRLVNNVRRESVLYGGNQSHDKINNVKGVEVTGEVPIMNAVVSNINLSQPVNDKIDAEKLLERNDDENNNSRIDKAQYNNIEGNSLKPLEEATSPSRLKQSNEEPFRSLKISDPLEDLAIVENKITNIRITIGEWNASPQPQDKLYRDISNAISSCVSEIDGIDAGNVAFVREQKGKLSKELSNCEVLFRNKFVDDVSHPEELNQIRKILGQLSEVEIQINNFSGSKNDNVYSSLDELLVTLMVQLNNVKTYNDKKVTVEKSNGIQSILKNIRHLCEKAEEK